MSYFTGNAQIKTAALLASTFLALFCLILYTTQFMRPAGDFLAAPMVEGSPVVLLGELIIRGLLYILGMRVLSGAAREALFYIVVLAPYPLMGWLIGYRWPLRDASLNKLLLAVLFRFAMVWVPMVAFGLFWLVFTW